MANSYVPDRSMLFVLTAFSFVLWFVYDTPEKTSMLLSGYGLNMPSGYDLPTIFPLFGWLWVLILGVQCFFIYNRAFHSDSVWAEGLDNSDSCVGGRLHEKGIWAWIRAGGIKSLPIEGRSVIIGLRSHCYRVGTHIIYECAMVPDSELVNVPLELKDDIRPRRDGLFGVESCSVGYFSTRELNLHKEFKFDGLDKYLDKDEQGKAYSTSNMLLDIRDKTRNVDMLVQLAQNDPSALSRFLKTISTANKGVMEPEKKGIMQSIFGA